MKRSPWLLCGVFGCGLASLAGAQPARAELEQQRLAVQARYERELQACQARFAVTACADEARTRRRVADTPLREALLQQEAQARQQRAEERRRAVSQRQLDRLARRPAQLPGAASTAPR